MSTNVRLTAEDEKVIRQVQKKLEHLGVVRPTKADAVRFALRLVIKD
jgi:hypothetical protein